MNRGNKTSQKGGDNPSVIQQVEAFLQASYPGSYLPKIIAKELDLNTKKGYETVKKACQNLLKSDRCQRPTGMRRAWYMGIPTPENISQLEEPPVEVHNIKLKVTYDPKIIKKMKGKKEAVSPPSLYTQRELIELGTQQMKANDKDDGETWYQAIRYWTYDRYPYKVTFQFYKECILAHFHSTKKPIGQEQVLPLYSWLEGILQGWGVNLNVAKWDIVYVEMSKDYELITITPTMITIQNLLDKSLLRIYRKYRNLHRLELGTTFEGEKTLYEIFEQFGKPQADHRPMNDEGGMFQ